MDRERILGELDVEGEFDEDAREKHPPVVRLMEDVLEHGEVHAAFADDSERYVEVRQGTATFDFDGEVIVVDGVTRTPRFAMAQLASWEKPRDVFEQE
ncbi:MAG: hypothetical protein ABEH77_04490 [Halobacteriaceae archaeon]